MRYVYALYLNAAFILMFMIRFRRLHNRAEGVVSLISQSVNTET
jgi:hypothetical protein